MDPRRKMEADVEEREMGAEMEAAWREETTAGGRGRRAYCGEEDPLVPVVADSRDGRLDGVEGEEEAVAEGGPAERDGDVVVVAVQALHGAVREDGEVPAAELVPLLP